MGFTAFLATTLGKVVLGIGITLGVVVAAGAGLYLSDYGVEAVVVGKDCEATGTSTVTVETKVGGFPVTQALPFEQCTAVSKGNFVVYNIQSERMRLYESEGGCMIYDSETGISNECGGTGGDGSDGGLFNGWPSLA